MAKAEFKIKIEEDIKYRALLFATGAHAGAGNRRKYTNEPYIFHPMEVAELVESVTSDADMIAAAYLHDVVEDTAIDLETIHELFGHRVRNLVNGLTDISEPEDGNRAARKELDRMHTAAQCPDTKTIKLADLISNSQSIATHDPDFAKIYMKEKRALLEVLTEGDETLYARARQIVDDYFAGEKE